MYHHTPSTTLHYGLREGLRLVLEEGLEDRWFRHQAIAEYLWEKMENNRDVVSFNLEITARRDLIYPPGEYRRRDLQDQLQ